MQNRLIFGTASLHRLATSRQRQRTLAAALDAGLQAFDLAPAYGNGIDELEVGLALSRRRDPVALHTKYGIPIVPYGAAWRHAFAPRRLMDRWLGGTAGAYRRRDFSTRELTTSLEASLRRLRADHVECLFLHEPISALTTGEIDDIVACGRVLQDAGKIRQLGVAGPLASLKLCPSLEPFDVLQVPCDDLRRIPELKAGQRLILYGLHAAFLASGATEFGPFVRTALSLREGTRGIVTSRRLDTIRSFRTIGEA